MVKPDRSLHICLLGDPGIGQSTLLRAYRGVEEREHDGGQMESFIHDIELEGELHRVRFTDSAGGPAFERLRKPVLNTAHCLLVCFALDNPDTLTNVKNKWLPLVDSMRIGAPVILVGLRTDIREQKAGRGCVSRETADSFAYENELVTTSVFLECSAKDGKSVADVFSKALLTAQEYYGLKWQRLKPKAAHERPGGPGLVLEELSEDPLLALDAQRDAMATRAMVARHVDGLEGPESGHHELCTAEESYLAETVLAVEDTAPLQREQVTGALSVLGVTPERKHAYLRVDLGGLGLTTLEAIRGFPHLQFVNVSENRLRSLEPLGSLRNLLHLNASLNLLSRTQSLAPPNQLETMDLSYNMISDLGHWGVHKFLRELNLRGNFIRQISDGLRQNRMLMYLDLSENQVSCVENLNGLELRTLYLAQNQLTSIEGISVLNKLQVLNIRHNELRSLKALQANDIPRLRKLCVSENQIGHIQEVEWLANFEYLCDLFLAPNPIQELPYYRAQILNQLPRLRWLDDQAVTPEEKVKASVIYGADIEKRQKIYEDKLPNETFVDRRLITEEMIARMEEEKFGQRGGFAMEEDEDLRTQRLGVGEDEGALEGVTEEALPDAGPDSDADDPIDEF